MLDFDKIKYTNFHAHSHFSLQDGFGTIAQHIEACMNCGHQGVALTDHGTMAGVLELEKLSHDKDFIKKLDEKINSKRFYESSPPEKYKAAIKAIKELKNPTPDQKKACLLLYKSHNVGLCEMDAQPLLNALGQNHKDLAKEASSLEVKIKERSKASGKNNLFEAPKTIPAVLGSELYITDNPSEHDRENKYWHIVVLAKNEVGYRNLCQLNSFASKPDHFYFRPRITIEELIKFKEGLIITSACFLGIISKSIFKKTGKEVEYLKLFKEHFNDDFYIEIHLADLRWNWDKATRGFTCDEVNEQIAVNKRLIELATEHGVKCIIAQDSHMPTLKDHPLQTIMIQNSPSGKDGWHFHEACYTMTIEEMWHKKNKMHDYITDEQFTEWCNNTQEILEKTNRNPIEFEPMLPEIDYAKHPVHKDKKFDVAIEKVKEVMKTKDETFYEILCECDSDLSLKTMIKVILFLKKIDITNRVYRERLTEEILDIQFNGNIKLNNYFALDEFIAREHEKNFKEMGYGRGSGGGSLFCYAIGISDVDPIKYQLMWERFLPRERSGQHEHKYTVKGVANGPASKRS